MSASPALDLRTYNNNTANIPLKKMVTEAEYWKTYYHYPDVTLEWNNGYLEEKSVSDVLTISMYKWFLELLEHYLRTHTIAQSVLLEMGFRLVLPQKNEIRRPDLGVVLNTNSVPLKPTDNSYKGIYDLCIEAVSDSSTKDIKRDTVDKKLNYAQGGVKEYYILDGQDRYLEFYGLSASGVYVPIKPAKGKIIQSTVLPGFQFWIDDLFTKPSPDEMIDDPIYQHFVLPGYREAKQQAEIEKRTRQQFERQVELVERQVELEKKGRQKAEQQAKQLADKLRSLGIDLDNI